MNYEVAGFGGSGGDEGLEHLIHRLSAPFGQLRFSLVFLLARICFNFVFSCPIGEWWTDIGSFSLCPIGEWWTDIGSFFPLALRFSVMTYDGVKLLRPRAIEVVFDITVSLCHPCACYYLSNFSSLCSLSCRIYGLISPRIMWQKKKSGPLTSFVIVIFYVACSQFGLSSDLTTFMIAPFIFLHNK